MVYYAGAYEEANDDETVMLLHAAWILLLQYLLPCCCCLKKALFSSRSAEPFRDTHKPPQLTHRMNSKNAIDRYRTVATPHEIFEFGDILRNSI